MRGTNSTQSMSVDPLIGTRLGEYDVLEAVGEGGMGVVYRGVQPVIKKRVAIKVLKPNMAGDATQVRRLADEAVAVNSIRHRNIIDIFSFGMLPDGRPYIVMEFLEGQPLDAYLAAHGRIPLAETLSLLIAMSAPLAAAHRAGVIHRDLKPSNVFVCQSPDGERYLKLLDFGLAKKGLSLDGTTEQTSRAQVTGTPNYMAPEQARGQSVSGRTDLYALGVIAYEMVTGELPYAASAPMEVLMQHVSSPIPQARVLAPECPEALERLISRMLEKHWDDRPQTAEEVRAELIAIARTLEAAPGYETVDPVSGEYVSRAYKPLMTPDGLKPVSQMSVDLHAATFVSHRALKQRRWPYVVGLVALCLLLIAAIASVSQVEPVKPVAAQPPPVVVPVVAPVLDPVVVEPAPVPVPVQPVPVAAPPKLVRQVKTPPSAAELKSRIAAMERALARATPEGEDPDPSALTLLRKYKVEATMLDTAEDRQRLSENLKAFDQTFLRR